MKKLFLTLIVIVSGLCSSAQAPQSFRYQAVARDNSGILFANQSVSFRISILSGSATGTLVYAETHMDKNTNAFGLVEFEIGLGTPVTGLFTNINWAGATHFVKVEVDPDNGTAWQVMGTMQMVSVPYALHAGKADQIPDNTVTTDKIATEAITSPKIAPMGALTGQVLKWNGANWSPSGELWTESGSNIYRNSGKVGIGITNPQAQFDVRSKTTLGGIYTESAGGWSLQSNSYGSSGVSVAALSDGGTAVSAENPGLIAKLCSTPDNAAGYFSGNVFMMGGKVGVGVTNPQAVLDVRSKTSTLGIYTESTGGWSLQANSFGSSGVSIAALSDGGTAVSAENPGLIAKLCSTPDNAAGYFNGNVFMMGGKVGVGVTNPQAILDVRSKTSTLGIYTESAGGWSLQANSYGSSGVSVAALSDGGTAVSAEAPGFLAKLCSTADNAAGYFTGNVFIRSGKLGIGTTAPSAPLEVSANLGPNLVIRDSNGSNDRPGIQFTNNNIHFIGGDDGSEEIFGIYSAYGNNRNYAARLNVHGPATDSWGKFIGFTHDGNNGRINTDAGYLVLEPAGQRVGIGTDAPTQSLDVNGNARIRGIGSGAYAGTLNRMSDGTLTTASSDIRLKENVETLYGCLIKVLQLRGVSFTWKTNPEFGTRYGFIAQEFEKVIPELVFTNETDGYKGINYAEVTAVLVEAIKELKAENEQLKNRNAELEINHKSLIYRIDNIESLMKVIAEK